MNGSNLPVGPTRSSFRRQQHLALGGRLKYAIVSHAHIDHIGGATYLQEKFGTRIILSEVDWQLAEATVTKHRPFGDHRTIARSAVNSPRRLPAPRSRMPRQSPPDSADAFCASGATYQRTTGRTLSDSPTGLASLKHERGNFAPMLDYQVRAAAPRGCCPTSAT